MFKGFECMFKSFECMFKSFEHKFRGFEHNFPLECVYQWCNGAQILKDGDRVDFLYFMGGGAC